MHSTISEFTHNYHFRDPVYSTIAIHLVTTLYSSHKLVNHVPGLTDLYSLLYCQATNIEKHWKLPVEQSVILRSDRRLILCPVISNQKSCLQFNIVDVSAIPSFSPPKATCWLVGTIKKALFNPLFVLFVIYTVCFPLTESRMCTNNPETE